MLMKPRVQLDKDVLTLTTLLPPTPIGTSRMGNVEYVPKCNVVVGTDKEGRNILASLHVFTPTQQRPQTKGQR